MSSLADLTLTERTILVRLCVWHGRGEAAVGTAMGIETMPVWELRAVDMLLTKRLVEVTVERDKGGRVGARVRPTEAALALVAAEPPAASAASASRPPRADAAPSP